MGFFSGHVHWWDSYTVRVVISSDRYISELWDHCSRDHSLWQGRCWSTDADPCAWQLVVDSSPGLTLLLIKYSEIITVVRQSH